MKNTKLLLLNAFALLTLQSCVTADENGLGINGTCIVCIKKNTNISGSSSNVNKDNIVVGTTFNSPTDVDSTYAAIKSEFNYRARDEFSSNTPDTLYMAQEAYKHTKTPGSYYHISEGISYEFNNKVIYPIVEFEILKRGSRAKIKLYVHHRLSDNDAENKHLMNKLLAKIKRNTLAILR
ncbi:MAG: hypothetical protein KGV46_02915 [Pasteurella sp.]|nr:hypothetical protein [Pasteurella sp.]